MFNKKSTPQYRRYTRSTAGNIFYFSMLFLAGAFTILPLVYCIITSFKPLDELLIFPPQFFVKRPTLENYLALPSLLGKIQVPVSRYFFNSLFVAIAGTFLHIIAASLAAFGFSKSKVKGRKTLFWIVQLMLLYNAVTLAIPRYYIYTTSVTARSPPSRDNCTTRIFCFISLIKSARLYAGCVCKILSANAAYAASADSA